MSCPPPRILIGENGRFEVSTHCGDCLAVALTLALRLRSAAAMATAPMPLPTPPASSPWPAASPGIQSTPRKKRWKTKDLAELILQSCKGTGQTYASLIAQFTENAVTPENAAEFGKALDRLYARKKMLVAIIEGHGYRWTKQKPSPYRERADGRPSPYACIVLEPMPGGAG